MKKNNYSSTKREIRSIIDGIVVFCNGIQKNIQYSPKSFKNGKSVIKGDVARIVCDDNLKIEGNVKGCVFGTNITICGNVDGSVFGINIHVKGNVGGTAEGENVIVDGVVRGEVVNV